MQDQLGDTTWRPWIRFSVLALVALVLIFMAVGIVWFVGRFVPKVFAYQYNVRAYDWSTKKEYDKAIADYTAAIRLDPKSANAFVARAAIWLGKNEYAKAIDDYAEAVSLEPHEAHVRNLVEWLSAAWSTSESCDGARRGRVCNSRV